MDESDWDPLRSLFQGWAGEWADPRSPAGGGGPGHFRSSGPLGSALDQLATALGLHPLAPATRHGDAAVPPPPAPPALHDIEIIATGLKGHKTMAITAADYAVAAQHIGCEAEVLMAIGEKESGKLRALGLGAFDRRGRPTILFERHRFAALTNHLYDLHHPDLSSPKAYLAGTARDKHHHRFDDGRHYGLFSWQYDKLARAWALNPDAAVQACSWGKFQIMGENYADCGFATPRAFVLAMCESEQRHLDALVGFCSKNLKAALIARDWAAIARRYNGPGYRKNNYDADLQSLYEEFKQQAGHAHG